LENSLFGYVILFKNAKEAEDAFKKRHIFDYKLSKYSSVKNVKELGKALPTQELPVVYKVLKRTTVRKGIEKTSDVIVDLFRGAQVIVDKLVNNRARIVKKNHRGVYKKFGWVSLYTDSGLQLLMPFTY